MGGGREVCAVSAWTSRADCGKAAGGDRGKTDSWTDEWMDRRTKTDGWADDWTERQKESSLWEVGRRDRGPTDSSLWEVGRRAGRGTDKQTADSLWEDGSESREPYRHTDRQTNRQPTHCGRAGQGAI